MLKGKPDKDAWDAVSPFLPQHELTFTWLSTTNHPHAQGSLPSPAHPSASPALLNPPPQHHKEWKQSPSHREWLKGCPRALHVLSQAGWAGGGPHCSPHKISLRKISHPLMLRKNCTKFLIKEGKLTEKMLACRLSLNQALFVRCIFYIERAPNRKASKHKAHLQLLHFPLHTLPPHHWSGHEAKAKTTERHHPQHPYQDPTYGRVALIDLINFPIPVTRKGAGVMHGMHGDLEHLSSMQGMESQ